MRKEIYLVEPKQKYVDEILSTLMKEEKIESKTIIIKPNIRSYHSPEQAKNTNPKTLDMVLSFICNNFNNKVIVGDSSIIGLDTTQSAFVSGLLEICEKYSVEFFDIKEHEFNLHQISIPPNTIELSKILDNDYYLINIPKLKTSYATPVSLSIKNLKGLLSDKSKRDFHQYGLDKLLVELYKLVKPDITIIDGLLALSLDTPIASKILIISDLCAELDVYVSEQLGIDLKNIGYLNDIMICKSANKDIIATRIGSPSILKKLKMNIITSKDFLDYNIQIVGHPCCGCYGSIFKAIQKINPSDNILFLCGMFSNDDLNQYRKEIKSFKKGKYKAVLSVGNCSPKAIKDVGIYVMGCPPNISDIENMLLNKEQFTENYNNIFKKVHKPYLKNLCNSICILDDEGLKIGNEYVMFYQERELMQKHAEILLEGKTKKDLLEIGYGLGIFSEEAFSIGVKSHTIIEVHPTLIENIEIWRGNLKEPKKVILINKPWQQSLKTLKKYDAIMYDSCSPLGYSNFDFRYLVEILCDKKLKNGGSLSFWNCGKLIEPIKVEILKRNFKKVYTKSYKMVPTPKSWTKGTNDFIIPIAIK